MRITYEAADLWNTPEGWQFNYSWRIAGELELPEAAQPRQITAAVKRALGYTGQRSAVLWESSDEKAFRLVRTCIGFNWRIES